MSDRNTPFLVRPPAAEDRFPRYSPTVLLALAPLREAIEKYYTLSRNERRAFASAFYVTLADFDLQIQVEDAEGHD